MLGVSNIAVINGVSHCKTMNHEEENTKRSPGVTGNHPTVPDVVVISRASHIVGATGNAGLVFAFVITPAGVYLFIAGTNRLASISSC